MNNKIETFELIKTNIIWGLFIKIKIAKENLDKTIFFEDTVKNLIPAKELGITTVWMKNSINEKDFIKNFNFIDYSFNNLNEFLDTIKMRG